MSGGSRPSVPLGAGEVLDAGLGLYGRSWRHVFAAVAVVAIPLGLIDLVVTLATTTDAQQLTNLGDAPTTGAENDRFQIGQLAIGLIGLPLTLIATGAAYRALADSYLHGKPDVGESLRTAGSRFLALFVLSILAFLGIAVGLLALVIPGIALAVFWVVAVPALLEERIGPTAALRRSFRLVRGRWWPSFGVLVVGIVILVLGTVALALPVGLLAFAVEDSLAAVALLSASLNALSTIVLTPLLAAFITVLYFDLRLRQERGPGEGEAGASALPPPAQEAPPAQRSPWDPPEQPSPWDPPEDAPPAEPPRGEPPPDHRW